MQHSVSEIRTIKSQLNYNYWSSDFNAAHSNSEDKTINMD